MILVAEGPPQAEFMVCCPNIVLRKSYIGLRTSKFDIRYSDFYPSRLASHLNANNLSRLTSLIHDRNKSAC